MRKRAGSNDPTVVSDDVLLQKIAKGDEAAYRHLIEKYAGRYWRSAMALVDDPRLAENLVLEPFSRLWECRAASSAVLNEGFFLWGYRVLLNSCRMTTPLNPEKVEGLRALRALSPDALLAWALFQLEELSTREISDMLRIPEEELLPLLQHARRALKATLKNAPADEHRDLQGES